jgi:hypothetical protein
MSTDQTPSHSLEWNAGQRQMVAYKIASTLMDESDRSGAALIATHRVAELTQLIMFALEKHPSFLNNNIGHFKQWLPKEGTV